MSVYIKAGGLSTFCRCPDNLINKIREAIKAMDADLSCVDAVYLGLMNPEAFTGVGNIASYVTDKVGLSGVPSVRIETASSTGAAVLNLAYAAVKAGLYKNVLVIAAEKMTHLSTPKVTKIISEVIEPSERRTGASMPSLAAMCARRFAYEQGLSDKKFSDILGAVAVKAHHYGVLNDKAQFRNEITRDDYLASRFIAEPLRLYDCSPISDGAAALIVSSDKSDVVIAGVGQGTDKQALTKRTSITSFLSTRKAAISAYNMAGFGPENVDFAEIHDAFTPFEVVGLIDTFLLRPEDVIKFYQGKEGYHDGRLPVNISGGLKSRGHPVGASGLAQIVECYKVMTGRYPKEITPEKTDVALTQSIGGLATNNFVTILKKTGAKVTPLARPMVYAAPDVKSDTDKRYRIYSATRLHTPPEGFDAPLDLVVLQRKGRLILARSTAEELPKIGSLMQIDEKVEGNLLVKEDGFLRFLGF
ncbi:Acetyl-CoA acetyltransferase-like protein [Denitrovibrio acetiphilus DSM 12809]|uniref:Acetyl-CoA acetyltransferase-like protein n=1 Tax=Denitrovibrio acetiphilus (strain DSM 12809 / NBRC 114555 / N2460) TaxID=522772 RepID=D4H4E4_DENA2|nr:thiolase [Denitrovibrio acetiphilus]ADD69273.1 Acetyl-CoA acetyltransferase-like protein [Denitrovibrio acetiphilus DSM 12809]